MSEENEKRAGQLGVADRIRAAVDATAYEGAAAYSARCRAALASPSAGGVNPGVAGPLIDVPGPVEVLGAANAYEPRPVLCIEPMTHGDARYADGRRAGLREAATLLRGAAALLGGSTGANALRCGAEEIEALVARTGEP